MCVCVREREREKLWIEETIDIPGFALIPAQWQGLARTRVSFFHLQHQS